MIIGNGLIASLFKEHDREDTIFFASGVSNSLEVREEAFLREEHLILETIKQNPDKILVYFSTCSIYDSSKSDSAYVHHKLKMEHTVSNIADNYLILRLSNVVGRGGNPNLLINYLVRCFYNRETINVHTHATRNLIDAEDVKKISLDLLDQKIHNKLLNLAYPQNYNIVEIIEIIESELQIDPILNLIKSGSGYEISIPIIENYFMENQLMNKELYLKNIIQKYYLDSI